MKRLNLLLMLFVFVSAQQSVRASSSEGYGVKAYAAGALATAGALGGAYKLMGSYQARQAAVSPSKDQMTVKVDQFNKIFESSRQKLQDQLMSFLKLSGKTYDICMEHVDKFQELIGKLEEMVFKIEHAHEPYIRGRVYSSEQKAFLDNVKDLLSDVRHQRSFAEGWANKLDESYGEFMTGVAMMFEDEITLKPKFPVILIEWLEVLKQEPGKPDKKVWVKKTYENTSIESRWKPVKTLQQQLPQPGSLEQIGIDIKQYYERFAKSYEAYMEIYNKQYGSYFTQLKGYFREYFKSKPAAVPVAAAKVAPAAVPVAV